MQLFVNYYLKLFFILTPFFVLSAFVSYTAEFSEQVTRQIAVKVTGAVIVSSFVIFLFGQYIFELFGITLDAFRIGAGAILFLSAVSMLKGRETVDEAVSDADIAVVPLALPITVGPGVIGVLLVMGTEAVSFGEKALISASLLCAAVSVGILLYFARIVESLVGDQGVTILSKVTGLIVSALSAQIVFTGIKNFLA